MATRAVTWADAPAVDWDAAIRQHHGHVLAWVLAHGIAPGRAEELVQEVWMKLMRQHEAGRLMRIDLPALALAQARFLAKDELRRRVREQPHPHDTDETPSHARIEHRIDARTRLAKIVYVLEREPANVRAVFEHTYGGAGLCATDVAAKVGLSTQRVRQILCELRAKLRAHFEDPCNM